MILSAMLVVTRDDAERAGVYLTREVYDFDSEWELEAFVARVQVWLEQQPIPSIEIGFPRKVMEANPDRLLEIIDRVPASLATVN